MAGSNRGIHRGIDIFGVVGFEQSLHGTVSDQFGERRVDRFAEERLLGTGGVQRREFHVFAEEPAPERGSGQNESGRSKRTQSGGGT